MLSFPRPPKLLRAHAVRDYLAAAGRAPRVVCLTCGNCAHYLRAAGCDVVEVGEGERALLRPARWLQPDEVARAFPEHFDATSGHLPLHLMAAVGERLRTMLGDLDAGAVHQVPCGSGETLCCLALAYPECKFEAVYHVPGNEAATRYNPGAPLNALVHRLAVRVLHVGAAQPERAG